MKLIPTSHQPSFGANSYAVNKLYEIVMKYSVKATVSLAIRYVSWTTHTFNFIEYINCLNL